MSIYSPSRRSARHRREANLCCSPQQPPTDTSANIAKQPDGAREQRKRQLDGAGDTEVDRREADRPVRSVSLFRFVVLFRGDG